MALMEDALLICTTATLLFALIIPMAGYVPPNVPNPWNDLGVGFGASASLPGSGTTTQANNPQNVQHTAALQGCAIGLIGGGLVGGAVGAAFFGVGAIPGFIIGAALGGISGCTGGLVVGNSFPTQTTQFFSSVVASTGPVGAFLQGVLVALQYVYPFITFAGDWIPFENSLLTFEPAFGAVLGALVTITIMLWILEVAKLFRGVGTLG